MPSILQVEYAEFQHIKNSLHTSHITLFLSHLQFRYKFRYICISKEELLGRVCFKKMAYRKIYSVKHPFVANSVLFHFTCHRS